MALYCIPEPTGAISVYGPIVRAAWGTRNIPTIDGPSLSRLWGVVISIPG